MNHSSSLASRFAQRLWFVTGKGGVGKTTLSAALGLLASQQGLKTLLVETHDLNHLGELFEVEKIGYDAAPLHKNLSLAQINPKQAFEEYVLQQIKWKFLYNAVFNNHYVRHFIDAVPGLAELLTIGKIAHLTQQIQPAQKTDYDLVIVDAPATGHMLSLLTIPDIVAQAVRVGPLKKHAQAIAQLLQDPAKTLVWLISLPEEMPVNETIELENRLRREAKVAVGPIVLNSLWPEVLGEEAQRELDSLGFDHALLKTQRQQTQQSRLYRDRLRSALAEHDFIELPLVYRSARPLEIATELSRLLRRHWMS